MPVNLRGRHFLTLKDFSQREINYLLDLATDLKRKKRSGIKGDLLAGKNIVLLFEKASTRTRCAFEVGAMDEGAGVTFLGTTDSQMGKKESMEDTAKVLGRFYDGIEFRGFKQETVEILAEHSGVPVWNGLTDVDHPTQVLADFLTIREQVNKPLHQVKMVYVGDTRNNMSLALMIGAAKMGMTFVGYGPASLHPDDGDLQWAAEASVQSGASISFSDDPECVRDADVIYTDVWVSMGEEAHFAERIALLKPYQVDMDLLRRTGNPDVIFLHCLPAFHDLNTTIAQQVSDEYGLSELEVTDEVFRSEHSKVFDEAENRLHTIKAIMVATIGNV